MKGIQVVVTYNCNIMCRSCIYKCGPYKKGHMDVNLFKRIVNKYYNEGYKDYILIEGGEVFNNTGLLSKYLKAIASIDNKKIVTTNGYWGNLEVYFDILSDLKKIGLDEIIIEYDYFHSAYININTIKNVISMCKKCCIDFKLKSFFLTKDISVPEDNSTFMIIKELKSEYKDMNTILYTNEKAQLCKKDNKEKIIIRYKDNLIS